MTLKQRIEQLEQYLNGQIEANKILKNENEILKNELRKVEFAQKFINVDEKIPIEFTPVLFKTKNGGLYLGIYYSKKEYGKWFRSVEEPDIDYCVDLDNQDEVIEWRYVDL